MPGWQERIGNWLKGPAPVDHAVPASSSLPSGSPLAEGVRQAFDAELSARSLADKQRLEAEQLATEQERLEAGEAARKTEELKQRLQGTLQEIYTRLGIPEILQDIRDNIWKGGELESPHFKWADRIIGGVAFRYETAKDGSWSYDFSSWGEGSGSGYENPRIYAEEEFFRIYVSQYNPLGIKLGNPALFVNSSGRELIHSGEGIPIDDKAKVLTELHSLIVEDSKQRLLDGRLPLSALVAKGRREIDDVVKRLTGREVTFSEKNLGMAGTFFERNVIIRDEKHLRALSSSAGRR